MSMKLYLKLVSQSFQELISYRLTATLISIFGLVFFTAEIVAGLVYYSVADNLFGLTRIEYMILIASATTMSYLYQTLFISSHENLAETIIEGELDYALIRPVNSFLYYSLYRIDFPSMINLFISIVLQVYLLKDYSISFTNVLLYICLILLGANLIFLLNQIIITLSFWIEKSQKLMAVPEYLVDFSMRPKNIYPKAIRVALFYIVPILLATNAPVLLIKHQLSTVNLLVLIISNILLACLALKMWKEGLKKYSSSN